MGSTGSVIYLGINRIILNVWYSPDALGATSYLYTLFFEVEARKSIFFHMYAAPITLRVIPATCLNSNFADIFYCFLF